MSRDMSHLTEHHPETMAPKPAVRAGDVREQDRPLDASYVLRLQRLAGNAAVAGALAGEREDAGNAPAAPSVRQLVERAVGASSSSPMPEPVRRKMEPVLNTGLGGARIHSDAASTAALGAQAYTVGKDIVVHPSQMSSPTVHDVLSHEAVHIAQQSAGPVAGTDVGDGVSVSDPSDRFEREAEHLAGHGQA